MNKALGESLVSRVNQATNNAITTDTYTTQSNSYVESGTKYVNSLDVVNGGIEYRLRDYIAGGASSATFGASDYLLNKAFGYDKDNLSEEDKKDFDLGEKRVDIAGMVTPIGAVKGGIKYGAKTATKESVKNGVKKNTDNIAVDSKGNQLLLTDNKNKGRVTPEDSTKPIKSYPATGEEKVYMGINKNQDPSQLNSRTGQAQNPGQFLTKDNITSQNQARENLAIPKDWKEEITHVQEYRIKKGTQVQESTVGKQTSEKYGTTYNGGGNQIEILNQNGNRIQKDVLIPVGKAKPIPKD